MRKEILYSIATFLILISTGMYALISDSGAVVEYVYELARGAMQEAFNPAAIQRTTRYVVSRGEDGAFVRWEQSEEPVEAEQAEECFWGAVDELADRLLEVSDNLNMVPWGIEVFLPENFSNAVYFALIFNGPTNEAMQEDDQSQADGNVPDASGNGVEEGDGIVYDSVDEED